MKYIFSLMKMYSVWCPMVRKAQETEYTLSILRFFYFLSAWPPWNCRSDWILQNILQNKFLFDESNGMLMIGTTWYCLDLSRSSYWNQSKRRVLLFMIYPLRMTSLCLVHVLASVKSYQRKVADSAKDYLGKKRRIPPYTAGAHLSFFMLESC